MLDVVAAYTLGVLPHLEASAAIDHLRTCEACQADYRLWDQP